RRLLRRYQRTDPMVLTIADIKDLVAHIHSMRPVERALQWIPIRTVSAFAGPCGSGNDSTAQIDPANDMVFSVGDIHRLSILGNPESFRPVQTSGPDAPKAGCHRRPAIARIAAFPGPRNAL